MQLFQERYPGRLFDFKGAEDYRVGASDADGRRSPYLEFFYGGGDFPVVVKLQVDFFLRKTCLVENPEPVAEPGDGLIIWFDDLSPLYLPLLTEEGEVIRR
jgi:hypothetical protein